MKTLNDGLKMSVALAVVAVIAFVVAWKVLDRNYTVDVDYNLSRQVIAAAWELNEDDTVICDAWNNDELFDDDVVLDMLMDSGMENAALILDIDPEVHRDALNDHLNEVC